MVTRPFYERGEGSILPQCDGPYQILNRPSDHTAILGDALTREIAFGGKPVSVARLVVFDFPPDQAFPAVEEVSGSSILDSLTRGDMVAVSYRGRVHVAQITMIVPEPPQITATVYEVPADCRYGPWARRRWEVVTVNGRPVSEVFPESDIVSKVSLIHGALDGESLERLAAHGLSTGQMPHRDKAIVSTYG